MTKAQIEDFNKFLQWAIELVPDAKDKLRLASVKYDVNKQYYQDHKADENALVSALPGSLHQFDGLPNDDAR